MSDGYRIGRLVFIVLAALLLLAPPSAAASGRCSLAGTWIGDNDAGLAFLITFIPLDPAHDRLASIAGGANDATGFGLFPTAVDYTPFQGEVKRTGRRTFDYTGLAYARDELGWMAPTLFPGAGRCRRTAAPGRSSGMPAPSSRDRIRSPTRRSSASRRSPVRTIACPWSPRYARNSGRQGHRGRALNRRA